MANKSKKKDNKNVVVGVVVAIVVVVVVVVAVVLAVRGNGLNDAYFKSDDTKYVLTIDNPTTGESETNSLEPVKTHIVYTYSGDQITGMKTYGEFKDTDTAKKAFDAIKESGEDMTNYTVEGKYIIITATADQYEGMTANDVKAQIEFMESLKNKDLNSGEEVQGETTTTDESATKVEE
ncbi:hypothetical protein IKF21_03220 [Candidatus Saccharibacteria bacterium]|nr:hypothetical protein [Candidatus Saccharibacteria bacterium]